AARQAGATSTVRHLSRTIRISSGDAKSLARARYALWKNPENLMGTWQATATRAPGVKLSVQSAGPAYRIHAFPELGRAMPPQRPAGSSGRGSGWHRVTRTEIQGTRSFG
ncbi:MAG: hypothetical protein ACRDPY_49815, partial [Streptosporangiaceae bacterium]